MNILVAIKAVELLAEAVPVITAFVKQIEAEIPEAAGSDKLAAVKAAVGKYLTAIEADAAVVAAALPKIEGFVNSIVAMLKQPGILPHAQAGIAKAAGEANAVIGAAQALAGAVAKG